MAKKPQMERTRLTIELNSKLDDELDRISEKYGRSKSDVLRLAIDLLSKVEGAKDEGMKVGAWRQDEEGHHRTEREFVY